MKNLVSLFCMLGIFAAIMIIPNSCKHEFSNPCGTNSITISYTKTDAHPTLHNGSITATATGGSNFEYSLNGAAFQNSGTFAGLRGAQNYQVVVKNSWGCTDTATVPIGLIDPCLSVTVSVTATKTDATLNQANGSITATATGGTGFTYSLNGGTFQASGIFTGLAAGNYTVAAKNSNGCTGVAQVAINGTDPCAGVTVTVTTTQVNPTTGQSNGSITASATGGTGFSYSLNGGTFQTSGTFSALAAGNYTVTAKNANGCTGVTQIALGANNPCTGVTVTVTTTQVNPTTGQSNGSITATATGGTGFTYSINGTTFQASGTFTGLAAGTYTITAKNSNGCLGTKQVTLTGTNPCTNINITLTATTTNSVPCSNPVVNGSITLTAGGSTGFTYNLNGGTYQASNVFNNIVAGTYTMGCKDANGCTKTLSVTVTAAAPGPLFATMRTLITTKCGGSGCHMNGANAAGHNFDPDCSIVTKWSQINGSCVTYTLKKMPINQQGTHTPLTAAEKAAITNWINAGHKFTD